MSERINVHLPMFSINSRSVIGSADEDRSTVTSHKATQGGHIHLAGGPGGSPADRDVDQRDGESAGDSPGSIGSIGSAGSVLSIGSIGSVTSIGSAGSVLSIGSAGSVLSIGSAGSVLSIGSAGSVLSIGSVGSIGAIGGRRQMATGLVETAATALTVAALVGAVLGGRA